MHMKSRSFCVGHHNGFQHRSLEGFDGEFDVGIKFQKEDPWKYLVDPGTAIKAWCAPVLVLYVSATHKDSMRDVNTLRYGLDSSRWANPFLTPNSENQGQLLELALPHVKADLELLKAGGQPDSPKEIVML